VTPSVVQFAGVGSREAIGDRDIPESLREAGPRSRTCVYGLMPSAHSFSAW